MNIELLKAELTRHEGCVNRVYKDSLGYATAGIGHLLKGSERSMRVGTPVSDEQIHEWFEADVDEAIQVATHHVECFDSLDEVRQRVMVNMTFNLGNKLGQFVKTLAALNAGDYEATADMLLQSKWATQVGRRADELCFAMANGYFNFEQ